ncbi:MAG: phosphotransferase family protein [Actinomycetota bacterium]|nr:phosphotransferase family protein [Actinomycetota bacterium]
MSDLPDEIRTWIEASTDATITEARRQPGGARKEAWFVDVDGADGPRGLFLRYDRTDPDRTGDPWTIQREGEVYLALQDTDVRVPRVIGVHPTAQAMLSERVTGGTWFSQIVDPAEQLSTAQDFMTQLAALHALDATALDLPSFPKATTIRDLVHHELDEMEGIIAHRGGPVDPRLQFSLRWLRANIPDYEGPVSLIQGDTGPGNFMYTDGKVVAVVDWELAHLGDPMDDIAWLSLRTTQEPFTTFPDRLREYEELTGTTIDERRVRYYQVMAETKILVMGHQPRSSSGDGPRPAPPAEAGNLLIYGMLHRRLWFEAIAAFVGLEYDPIEVAPDDERTDVDVLYQGVLDELRDVIVPALSDPMALRRGKGMARIVKYLRESARTAAFYEADELEDLTKALGHRPATVQAGRQEIDERARTGEIADLDYLRYAWRRTSRDNEVTRSASGALADRHWPELR